MLLLALQPAVPAAARPLPTKKQWLADVRAAMRGSHRWLDRRVERGGGRLAIVLDIDNTAIASHYAFPEPVRPVLRFATHARRDGVKVSFATARRRSELTGITRVLGRAGYRFAAVCGRYRSESIAHGKTRCRRELERAGHTVIAMVGNRSTDFAGGHYERAFRLPSYRNRLN
ncbi:hypothetical protein SFC88_12170 [Nocardioides sp. HM23]|uniref:HAD family acid phosphatase n=1 Tax=Nocardioides bizhenqiangii TaxID=3095076 RepID=UPI002ACA16EF|nr:HAD family acid phosphatase [Nocardioides sp. HM23]MDZ5621593.1 hypothetical protein [Nocardioides sp. HM23]